MNASIFTNGDDVKRSFLVSGAREQSGENHRMKIADPRPESLEAIASRMRALRATTGLSQQKFAERYGLGASQWANFETAQKRIGIDAALTLAREMRVPLDWIYLGQEAWLPAGLRDQIRAAMDDPRSSDMRSARRA